MGRTTTAIRWYAAVVLLAAAAGCSSTGSGVAGVSDAQSDATLGPRVIADPLDCTPMGEQCDAGAVCAKVCNQSTCCLEVICPADARPPPILATNYDQTCTVDSDCIAEGFGDPCECLDCANAAINQKSEPQYRADRAGTPNRICFCTFGPAAACCVHGMCQLAYQCSNPSQPTDAGAETGGGPDVSDAGADVVADAPTHAADEASASDAADASAE